MNNPDLTFTLTLEKANLIMQALGELPFRVSAELIAELRQQAQGQLQEAESVEDAPKAPAKAK